MMLVREWMRPTPATIKPRESVARARELLIDQHINQLPVVASGKLLGIVTDRDLRDAFPSVFDVVVEDEGDGPAVVDTKLIPVEEVMTAGVLTVTPAETVEQAALLMRKRRFGAVPVVDKGRLIGILTRSDVIDAFLALTQAVTTDVTTVCRSHVQK